MSPFRAIRKFIYFHSLSLFHKSNSILLINSRFLGTSPNVVKTPKHFCLISKPFG